MRVLKILGLLAGTLLLLLAAAVGWVLFLAHAVEADARAVHASLQAGRSPYQLAFPESDNMLFLDFYASSKADRVCGGAALREGTLSFSSGKPAPRKLAAHAELGAALEAAAAALRSCPFLIVTVRGHLPYRGAIGVHLKDGLVERVEDLRFLD